MSESKGSGDFIIVLSAGVIEEIMAEHFRKEFSRPVTIVKSEPTKSGYSFALDYVRGEPTANEIMNSHVPKWLEDEMDKLVVEAQKVQDEQDRRLIEMTPVEIPVDKNNHISRRNTKGRFTK